MFHLHYNLLVFISILVISALTAMSIRDIGRACGYESAGRFFSIFRKTHQITPNQYSKSFEL